MLTGISGSKTFFRASTMPFSTSAGSTGAPAVVAIGEFASVGSVGSIGSVGWVSMQRLLLRCRGQRREQGVPRQSGAFDPHGKFADAGEDGELAQVGRALADLAGGEQAVEDVEEPA